MSNIEAISSYNTPSHKFAIKNIRHEVKSHLNTKEVKSYTNHSLCKNSLTNMMYDFEKGSKEEQTLYRVMPVDGHEKIYFDTKDEYTSWRLKYPLLK